MACEDVLAGSVRVVQLGHVGAAWLNCLGLTWFQHRSASSAKPSINRYVKNSVIPHWMVLELGSESWSCPIPVSQSGMRSLHSMTQSSRLLFPF